MEDTLRRSRYSLSEFLHDRQSPLSSTCHNALRNQQLARMFQATLPPVLRGHVKFVRMDGDSAAPIAVLFADSPAWLSRARQQQQQLLSSIRAEISPSCAGLRLRVAIPVPGPVTRQRPPKKRSLSVQATQQIRAASNSVNDPALAEALCRLAAVASR
ncbi:DUF721 domain-containing protein [bacterium]|nr:DUF721 domain-containing protein [bacterium]